MCRSLLLQTHTLYEWTFLPLIYESSLFISPKASSTVKEFFSSISLILDQKSERKVRFEANRLFHSITLTTRKRLATYDERLSVIGAPLERFEQKKL